MKNNFYSEIINVGNTFTNTYLIKVLDGYILIDSGYPADYKKFVKKINKLNIDLNDIKYIVVTHVHADHVGFVNKLIKITNAKLICCKADKDRFITGTNVENVFNPNLIMYLGGRISIAFRKYTQTFEPIDVTNASDYTENPLIDYGINLFLLHGHTSNDLCIQYKDIVFCGDLCMNGFMASKNSPMWIEDNNKLVSSWEYLTNIKEIKYLMPGHGNPIEVNTLKENIQNQKNRKLYKLKKIIYSNQDTIEE